MIEGAGVEGAIIQRSNGGWEARIKYINPASGQVEQQSFYRKTEVAARAKLSDAREQLAAGEPISDAADLQIDEWLLPIAKGVASYIPGLYQLRSRRRHQQSASARYCYEVWMRHLTMLVEHNRTPTPEALAELGPGGSLGVGLAALLSGVDKYYALDIVEYSETDLNLALLSDLVDLFHARTPVDFGWLSESKVFPGHILTNDILAETLAPTRIDNIRRALTSQIGIAGRITVQYITPWNDPAVIQESQVDLIVSHSVLEHVDDLRNTYDAFRKWLRPGGHMSHLIDFSSHGLTRSWNGHWRYPELVWNMVVGHKPYLINRQPCSTHITLMTERGFEITTDRRHRIVGIPRDKLAARWQGLDDEDLRCASMFVQSKLHKH